MTVLWILISSNILFKCTYELHIGKKVTKNNVQGPDLLGGIDEVRTYFLTDTRMDIGGSKIYKFRLKRKESQCLKVTNYY